MRRSAASRASCSTVSRASQFGSFFEELIGFKPEFAQEVSLDAVCLLREAVFMFLVPGRCTRESNPHKRALLSCGVKTSGAWPGPDRGQTAFVNRNA